MKVLLLKHAIPNDTAIAMLRERLPAVGVLEYGRALDDAALREVEAVLGWQMPAGLVPRLPALRWVCAVSAGVEKLLVPELPPQVRVSRIVDAEQGEAIAQFVALMALRHARQLPLYEAQASRHDWTRHPTGPVRQRVAVLGMGHMGRAVAAMLTAVGFEVEGVQRHGGRDLDAVLADSDIVVCALPLTPDTENLFDARRLRAMKRGAYLINIARGGHVVEADLIEAVRSGQLAGAALDVQRREPLPADDPLWSVPGITVTPHIGAQSSPQTIAAQFIDGLERLQRGEMPLHTIDRARGY